MLALWVILHHLTGPGQALEPAARALGGPLFNLIRGGYMAVTTFFVLSGFVLARSYSKTDWNGATVRRYFTARAARIYPVYLLSLVIVAPIIAADRTPGKGVFAAIYGLLLQGWMGTLPVNWNTPAWSLSCEMFFYAAFPLTAILIRRANWLRTLAVAGVAFGLTRAMLALGIPDSVKPLIHFADFLMGMAAACAYGHLASGGRRVAGAWLYLPGCAAGAALIAWPRLLPHGVDLNTALRPLNALLLVGFALGGGFVARALSSRVAVYLGKSSYAMYILHVPVLWWYHRWARPFSPALYILLVIAISAAVYSLYEEPANRWLRGGAGGFACQASEARPLRR